MDRVVDELLALKTIRDLRSCNALAGDHSSPLPE